MEKPRRDRADQSRNAVAVFGQLRAQALAQVADGGVPKFLESGQRRTDDKKIATFHVTSWRKFIAEVKTQILNKENNEFLVCAPRRTFLRGRFSFMAVFVASFLWETEYYVFSL